MQGDVGALPFEEDTFDYVLCMNGLHVFPNKDKAYSEILRTLKPDGELLACFYIAGEQKVADWLAKTVMTRMGWFTPPFDTANDVRQRLEPYYDILDFHVLPFFRGFPLINNAFTIFRISVNKIMLWFVLSSFDNRKAIIRCRV